MCILECVYLCIFAYSDIRSGSECKLFISCSILQQQTSQLRKNCRGFESRWRFFSSPNSSEDGFRCSETIHDTTAASKRKLLISAARRQERGRCVCCLAQFRHFLITAVVRRTTPPQRVRPCKYCRCPAYNIQNSAFWKQHGWLKGYAVLRRSLCFR